MYECPGDENHLDVAIVLDSVFDDHGSDAPDLTLESAVPRRGSPWPIELLIARMVVVRGRKSTSRRCGSLSVFRPTVLVAPTLARAS